MAVSIDEAKLREAFTALQRRVTELEILCGLFVPERELDTPRGNPQVKFPPRGWGDEWKGKRFSECPPDFLDALAESLSYAAAHPKAGREKFAEWNKLDAARARSWARRLRAGGWTPPTPPERPAGRPSGARPGAGRPAGSRPTGQRPGRGSRAAPAQAPPEAPPPAERRAPTEEPRPNGPADVGYTAPEQPDDDEDLFGPEDDPGDAGRPNEPDPIADDFNFMQ
jgi:hypothetical protein